MKVCVEELKKLCAEKGISLSRLLSEAGVSKNAYYSLARKETVLPGSIVRIASQLGVRPSSLLREPEPEEASLNALLQDLRRIAARNRKADPDNIRHTLLLLQEEPIQRLRRALTRGRRFDFHG